MARGAWSTHGPPYYDLICKFMRVRNPRGIELPDGSALTVDDQHRGEGPLDAGRVGVSADVEAELRLLAVDQDPPSVVYMPRLPAQPREIIQTSAVRRGKMTRRVRPARGQ